MLTNDAANEIGQKLMPYRFTSEGKTYIRSVILTLNPMDQEEILMRWPALVPFCLEKITWSKKDDEKPIVVGDKSTKRESKYIKKDIEFHDNLHILRDENNVVNDVENISELDIEETNDEANIEEKDDSVGGLLEDFIE